jgi:pyruvate/2-oxoglutarate dehydrogenase complex dihydrolipoamide dehydrogenase (E3) component
MHDVIVIGGGPAGVTAALRARNWGNGGAGRTWTFRGVCTNDGCVPTRVLAKAARLVREAEHFSSYGLVAERPQVDFAQLMAETQQTVYRMHEKKQLLAHLEQAGVTVLRVGEARFVDEHTLELGNGHICKGQIIICVAVTRVRRPFLAWYAITHHDVVAEQTAAFHRHCGQRSDRLPVGFDPGRVRRASVGARTCPRLIAREDVHIARRHRSV